MRCEARLAESVHVVRVDCVYCEVLCRCHVSEICDVLVKDGKKYVCV